MPDGALDIVYGCATKVAGSLDIVYWCAPLVAGELEIVYGCAQGVEGALEICYRLPGVVAGELDIVYAVSGGKVDGALEIVYGLPERMPVAGCLDIVYGCAELPGWHEDHVGTGLVAVDGVAVGVSSISIKNDLAWLSCTVTVESERDYAACVPGLELTVSALGELFVFTIESRDRTTRHGGIDYDVTALSAAAWLDAPYAEPVSGELSGMASGIVAGLAGAVTIDWQTVDWPIGGGVFFAADETPLELIRKLAAAAGAELQSLPNGILLVEALYPVAVPGWSGVTPASILVDQLTWFDLDERTEHKPGYNKYRVSDSLTDKSTLRQEEQALTGSAKGIRGYQVPWTGVLTLRHTGGAWVTIEPMGIESRQVEEVVEFVAGSANTGYPIYGLVTVDWLHEDLGTVDFNEDGTLEAGVDGESLLAITYITKCKKWLVQDSKNEQLQLVLE